MAAIIIAIQGGIPSVVDWPDGTPDPIDCIEVRNYDDADYGDEDDENYDHDEYGEAYVLYTI